MDRLLAEVGGFVARLTTTAAGELTIDLFDPAMTALHRAGLAGLWMTLDRFEQEGVEIAGGSWRLDRHEVVLRWGEEGPRPFFSELLDRAFPPTKDGLIWFPAYGDPAVHPAQAVLVHDALLGTFLQHGRTRRAEPSNKRTGALAVPIDDRVEVYPYQKVSGYAHQKPSLFADGRLSASVRLAGWQYPGGVVRHVGLGDATALSEPPARALALLFCPVGVFYLRIGGRGGGVRPQFALVIPEINDLGVYAELRRFFAELGAAELWASGSAEAGWRVLAEAYAKRLLASVETTSCRVVAFGVVPWSTQQKTRVDLFTVTVGTESRLRVFVLCTKAFPRESKQGKEGARFWDVPQMPELVARNLTAGRPWWEGFADFIANPGRRKHVLSWERKGVIRMVSEAQFDHERERVFVEACHEAWRSRLAQLGERSRAEGVSFQTLAQREFERARVAFGRCKTAATLRETVTDFWARSGRPLPSLKQGWPELLPLFGPREWRRARDLALLALASYAPASKQEEAALESDAFDSEGGEQ
jgi:CRISPR-associated protein Cas8a1/Csx13